MLLLILKRCWLSEIMHLDKTKKTSGHIPVDMLKLSANHC